MKIAINDVELTFNKSGADGNSKVWYSTVHYNQYELDFEFDEVLFFDKKSNETTICWKLIEKFVDNILKNLDLIQSKGSSVLEELHRQVFGLDKLVKTKGYFRIGSIALKKLWNHGLVIEEDSRIIPYFEYDIYYFLESKEDRLMDPYHSYFAHFSNHNNLTITGVSRFG
jgi:hypothetical protein